MIAFAVRGALAWGMEVAGRRAAWSVLSELRLALAEKRLRAQPIAHRRRRAAPSSQPSRSRGSRAWRAIFARYLPQVVLATVVPLLVVLWVAVVDPVSALIMLFTLPLVPVFMWLIGRYTEERTQERWEALRDLSTHFLDVVRGLPTLRALGLGQSEAERIGVVSERYRSDHDGDAPRQLPVRRRCWSWLRRWASLWSPSTPACAWSLAASGSRPG